MNIIKMSSKISICWLLGMTWSLGSGKEEVEAEKGNVDGVFKDKCSVPI